MKALDLKNGKDYKDNYGGRWKWSDNDWYNLDRDTFLGSLEFREVVALDFTEIKKKTEITLYRYTIKEGNTITQTKWINDPEPSSSVKTVKIETKTIEIDQ